MEAAEEFWYVGYANLFDKSTPKASTPPASVKPYWKRTPTFKISGNLSPKLTFEPKPSTAVVKLLYFPVTSLVAVVKELE